MTDPEVEYQKSKAELEILLSGEKIYNCSDFKWLKIRANRRFSDELSEFIRNSEMRDTEMLYLSAPSWNHFSSCIKKIKAMNFPDISEDQKESVLKIIYKWEGIAQLIEKATPLVIKGRKPSDRKMPRRTLENTGTCPVCAKNCKLDACGKMVNHGYTIEDRLQQGLCFGVGKPPWEISPQGTIDYINKCLVPTKIHLESCLKVFVWSPKQRMPLEWELKEAAANINYFEKKIANWKKKPLPNPSHELPSPQ